NQIIPALQGADSMLSSLISYQKDSVAQAQDSGTGGNSLFTLYTDKKKLVDQMNDLYNTTLPWAIATFGGPSGDKAGSHATIKSWRDSIQKYMNANGYVDSNGVQQESIPQFLQDMADRTGNVVNGHSPNLSRTEVLYGETQPYLLSGPNGKIGVYTTE